MSMKTLGPSFDLHLGGEDLIFPHHEDEIAQSEGAGAQAAGEPFVKYWLHGAHLLVEGKKMSKSLGNYFTLRDLLAKGFTGREVRYLLLTAHYRESFNFTLEGLQGARTALGRIEECLKKMYEFFDNEAGCTIINGPPIKAEPDITIIKKIGDALDDDFNVSKAWAVVFEWIRNLNRLISQQLLPLDEAKRAIATWKELDERLFGLYIRVRTPLRMSEINGVVRFGTLYGFVGEEDPPQDIRHLLEARQAARKAKDFKRADAIRDELKAKGWTIEDTPKGPRLKRL
jgi:cysteinyl-tRNA synthetase